MVVGASDGDEVGKGDGWLCRYVGSADGIAVGRQVGKGEGSIVGAP